jgi:hypothetical protein
MSDGHNRPKKNKGGSRHHIICRSIGGPNIEENIYDHWSGQRHAAYHLLFQNLLPSAAIERIGLWTDNNGQLKLGVRRTEVWRKAFGKRSPAQAIEFIKEKFLPTEKLFLEGKLIKKQKEAL